MADQVKELRQYTYLTNSDAHSLPKIAREYQKVKMKEPNFHELKKALKCVDGREVECNYGLDPRLGKYYETTCENCLSSVLEKNDKCMNCGYHKFIKGVASRIEELSLITRMHTSTTIKRPIYIHQIPLQFIPGLGPKTMEKLRKHFKTEMNIIHEATRDQLESVVSAKLAEYIIKARNGELSLSCGGGGIYGRINK